MFAHHLQRSLYKRVRREEVWDLWAKLQEVRLNLVPPEDNIVSYVVNRNIAAVVAERRRTKVMVAFI